VGSAFVQAQLHTFAAANALPAVGEFPSVLKICHNFSRDVALPSRALRLFRPAETA
jgi:hypothetical protein